MKRETQLDLMAKIFRIFSNPTRLAIVESIMSEWKTVSQIMRETGKKQPNVSNYLKDLKKYEFICSKEPREWRWVKYRVTEPFKEQIKELLEASENLLAKMPDEDKKKLGKFVYYPERNKIFETK